MSLDRSVDASAGSESETTPEVCLRCGDFLAPATRAVVGLALCRRCFEPKAILPDPLLCTPPLMVFAAIVSVVFTGTLVGVVLGVAGARWLGGDLAALSRGGGIGAAVVLVAIPFTPIRTLVDSFHDRLWKRAVCRALGVASTPLEACPFVFFRPRPRDLSQPMTPDDVGLLVEGDQAFAIIARRGSRLVVECGKIRKVETGGEYFVTGRPYCVRVECTGEPALWIAIREGPTRSANVAATDALAGRLRAKIEVAGRQPPP